MRIKLDGYLNTVLCNRASALLRFSTKSLTGPVCFMCELCMGPHHPQTQTLERPTQKGPFTSNGYELLVLSSSLPSLFDLRVRVRMCISTRVCVSLCLCKRVNRVVACQAVSPSHHGLLR